MREVLAVLSALVLTAVTVRYIWMVLTRRITPAPAAWVVGAVAITISFAAYWDQPNHTWLGNITNLAGAIEIWIVLAALLWVLRRRLLTGFDSFQRKCLVFSAAILLFWYFANQPVVSFILIQVMMTVAYAAVIGRITALRENQDSTLMWTGICLAGIFGLGPALIDGDWFGIVNSIRVILSAGYTSSVMIRLDHQAYRSDRFAVLGY